MPIYDYVCTACRHLIEVIHGIDVAGPQFCPSCGAAGTMRKAMVSPAIHFKGSGWAKKDRSSTNSARTKAGANSSSGGETGGSASAKDGASNEGASVTPTSGETATTTSGDAPKASPATEG